MVRTLRAPIAVLLGWMLLGAIGEGFFFQQALSILDARAAQRMLQALSRLLEHAHRVHDDLILQEAVSGAALAPGVAFACVIDKDNRILAHSKPSRVGQRLVPAARTPSQQRVWSYPLKDSAVPWGSIVIGTSQQVMRTKIVQQVGWLFTNFAIGVLCVFWLAKRWTDYYCEGQAASERLAFECGELQREGSRERQQRKDHEALTRHWLQSALDHNPRPVSLLDHSQRWVADNRLGGVFLKELQGRSWQDNPVLSALGDALQRSLEQPGEKIAASGVDFLTEKSAGHSWTWVFWNLK